MLVRTGGPGAHQPTLSALLHNAIYVTGGFDATMYTATAERMDPREGKWSPVRHHLLWCCLMPLSVITVTVIATAGAGNLTFREGKVVLSLS